MRLHYLNKQSNSTLKNAFLTLDFFVLFPAKKSNFLDK